MTAVRYAVRRLVEIAIVPANSPTVKRKDT